MNSNKDLEHLRLLSIFHYVVAGLLALFAMIPFVHLAVGIAIISGVLDDVDSGSPPPAFIGWVFVAVAATLILGGWTLAIVIAVAGRKLRRRTGHMFCLVVAGIECIFTPFGTVLGVFTIIVLMRPSVRVLFGGRSGDGRRRVVMTNSRVRRGWRVFFF